MKKENKCEFVVVNIEGCLVVCCKWEWKRFKKCIVGSLRVFLCYFFVCYFELLIELVDYSGMEIIMLLLKKLN